MIAKAHKAIVTLIALMTFVFVADRMVWDSQVWECLCPNIECEWCATDDDDWSEFHADAFEEYADEFTALFNAIEFKVSKNGRSMVRRPGDKSFRFVKKG